MTPFAWSVPHEVNDHVAGVAGALRNLGHEVTVLAPSTRAADLLAGRRALLRGEQADVIAVHMEAINHCLLTREQLRARTLDRVRIPADGRFVL